MLLGRAGLHGSWGGDAWTGGFEPETAVIVAGDPLHTAGWRMYTPADEVIAELAAKLRSLGAGLLMGDFCTVPAIRQWLRGRAERFQQCQEHPSPGGWPGHRTHYRCPRISGSEPRPTTG